MIRLILPDGDQNRNEEREQHLKIGLRIETNDTQDNQLNDLSQREQMHLPLRAPSDIMGRRIM